MALKRTRRLLTLRLRFGSIRNNMALKQQRELERQQRSFGSIRNNMALKQVLWLKNFT